MNRLVINRQSVANIGRMIRFFFFIFIFFVDFETSEKDSVVVVVRTVRLLRTRRLKSGSTFLQQMKRKYSGFTVVIVVRGAEQIP